MQLLNLSFEMSIIAKILLMINKLMVRIILLLLATGVISCTSVNRYNQRLVTPIPVVKLQKDIQFIERKLHRLYPNLYGYISKEQLAFKFDSIRKVVNRPMTTKEFYFVIAPVIASVRQGHMTTGLPQPLATKAQRKHFKNRGEGPLTQFTTEWINHKMIVLKHRSDKKYLKPGAEIVSINGITPQALYTKFRPTLTSDGFNETYIRRGFGKRLSIYYTGELGLQDSLQMVFKQKDSLYSEWIKRKAKPIKKNTIKSTQKMTKTQPKDTLKPLDSLSKTPKKEPRFTRKERRIFDWDPTTKEFSVALKKSVLDSSLYVLRIKNFSGSKHHKAYSLLFDSIKKMNLAVLVLDLRDNPGGRIGDAVNLYRHFIDKETILLRPSEVTSKTSLWKLGVLPKLSPIGYPFFLAGYPFYMGFSYFRTTKRPEGGYQYKLVGSRTIKPATNAYLGKLFVLINGGSFSAACIESVALKNRPNTYFVGEETGGAFNGTVAGIMPVVRLPYSKISVRLGLMNVQTIAQSEREGRGVFPDITILPTIEDRVKARDPELEYVVKMVQQSR